MREPARASHNQFSVTVTGDVPDIEQARLRLRGLFHSGHVGMSRTGDTRSGSCESTFDVFAETPEAARALAERELGRGRILAVQPVG